MIIEHRMRSLLSTYFCAVGLVRRKYMRTADPPTDTVYPRQLMMKVYRLGIGGTLTIKQVKDKSIKTLTNLLEFILYFA